MNSLNILLLRLILDQPKIIINSQLKDLAWQINLLCSGSVLNPVTASAEEMQSVVFILPNREEIPPFSFPDISNVWVEEGSGAGRIQFRKINKAFHTGQGLVDILTEFKDLGYWSPDFSFSVELVESKDSQDYLKGIQKRLEFLKAEKRFDLLDELREKHNEFVKLEKYDKASGVIDEAQKLREELYFSYQEKFGS